MNALKELLQKAMIPVCKSVDIARPIVVIIMLRLW